MRQFNITINVDPSPKARARTVSKNGKTWSYTPKKTNDYEQLIRQEFKNKYKSRLIDGPVFMGIIFYFKKQKNVKLHRHYHIVRPDLTNLVKSIEDAGNGVLYGDDGQIAKMSLSKIYSDIPRIEVLVRSIKEPTEDDEDEDDDSGWDDDYDDQPPIEWIK